MGNCLRKKAGQANQPQAIRQPCRGKFSPLPTFFCRKISSKSFYMLTWPEPEVICKASIDSNSCINSAIAANKHKGTILYIDYGTTKATECVVNSEYSNVLLCLI